MQDLKVNISKDNITLKLILVLLGFSMLWLLFTSRNNMMNILWFVVIGFIAVALILKSRNTEKKDVFIGIILGLISMPSNFLMGAFTVIGYIGAVSVFKTSNNKIIFLKKDKNNFLITLVFILIVGGLLSALNIMRVLNAVTINYSLRLQWFLDAFRAGITEEVMFRFLFFAICVKVVEDQNLSKVQSFICYLIMIIPHVLMHFTWNDFNIADFAFLTIGFGVPFAIMQRKRDLVSAIGCHVLVDLIRFCLLGV